MIKEEIMRTGEKLLIKIGKMLDQSNNVEIYIDKALFDEELRRVDKETEWGLYKELTFYKGRWNEISMLLEDYNNKYYRVRKYFRADTLYVIPKQCKNTVLMKKVA